MNKEKLIKKIHLAAQRDEQKRLDPRYGRVMAFFIKKGFLKANKLFAKNYVARMRLEDAIWVGTHLEPRVLEVLPAAVARFPKAFIFDGQNIELENIVKDLRNKKEAGRNFMNIPYKKILPWMNLELNDKRTRAAKDKKITKTMRLSPQAIDKMTKKRREAGLSESAFLEKLIASWTEGS